MDSHLHAWSYRTTDNDDGGINPYGGESMSTAAHHASALTLSAGLRGHAGGGRREVSMSRAEYDPDRPLGDMTVAAGSRFSMFNIDASKSRYQAASAIAFDPLVVDDTAELDRVLQLGHAATAASLAARLRPTAESTSSGSDTDSSTRSNRPKSTEALHRVATFSPKRPKSTQPMRAHLNHTQNHTRTAGPSTFQRSNSSPPRGTSKKDENDFPTPKPPPKRSSVHQPEVIVQLPTPSTVGSKFTKMAKGLARDIEAEQRVIWGLPSGMEIRKIIFWRKARGGVERNPFSDIGNTLSSDRRTTPRAPVVHLPDVTGLTSAVASPAKNGMDYHAYEADKEPREAAARFLSVLASVQSKLAHLESENAILRRRVRELERELDACKIEVVREHSRVMERESVIIQQYENVQRQTQRTETQGKGKGKAKTIQFEDNGKLEERYREVVEEKKALKALIVTLHTHLVGLTSKLSSHQQLLDELRVSHECDAQTLRDKSMEVERLREVIEKLAGEVEVLKGVVEEGLNERRAMKQVQEISEEEESPLAPQVDQMMRTDRATIGSSANAKPSSRRFINGEELDCISLELEEKRFDHSGEASDDGNRLHRDNRAPSPSTAARGPPMPVNHAQKPTMAVDDDSSAIPFPQICGGHLERLFFSALEHNAKTCMVCHRRRRQPDLPSWIPRARVEDADTDDEDEGFVEGPNVQFRGKGKQREHVMFSQDPTQWRWDGERAGLPPQTVLARVLRELEDDFTHYKSIYIELAEQYGLMDAASNVSIWNVLAEHLREVIDILAQKGDQIASLYDLLAFKDKSASESVILDNSRTRSAPTAKTSSWGKS
ncbi:hypothetical protein PILCRDRAFT_829734 [Piloderma croceum F 1598]|uniref:Cep57 centrosome microtubule-binding domain-containing protein n=1 Tax=Piloderma croceum (strain F 1598) TaxID=765440 RepID=A0A0C3EXE8_PILCF|nr:hypothetical protein PILCRDRAFT_829734 [Piloderma croceum F 1598]